MSASTPSDALVLSAAEKAEIRRRKILAKKNARMAYAAGKRTALPSEAPPEPIEQVTQATPRTSANAFLAENHSAAERPVPDSLVAADPSLWNRSHDGMGLQRRGVVHGALAVLNAKLIRLTILTVLAVMYTAAVTYDFIPRWRVSAVEVFFSAEVCFLVPSMIEAIKSRSKRMAVSGHNGEAFPFTMLRLLSNIQDSVLLVRRIVNEFSVFMFVFLCTWYLVQALT